MLKFNKSDSLALALALHNLYFPHEQVIGTVFATGHFADGICVVFQEIFVTIASGYYVIAGACWGWRRFGGVERSME